MSYREHAVSASLRGLAECGWTNELPAGVASDVLPDGCMDLLWTGTELLVAGPDTAPHPYRPPAGRIAVGLRVAPGRLPALLAVPAAALRDQRVPLAELHPALASAATARLEGGAAPGTVLEELALALPGAPPESAVRAVLGLVRRGRSAAEVAEALGWTTRTLHRHSLSWFGYGPVVLRRILRFQAAAALLNDGVAPAEVAFRAGYADQPHLSREVRALAGASPGQLGSGA